MRLVIIESPFSGDVEENKVYLNRCIRDSILRGEIPFASHKMYTDSLNDLDPAERKIGIELGYAVWRFADAVVFYTDRGWSIGMKAAVERANNMAHMLKEERKIGDNPRADSA